MTRWVSQLFPTYSFWYSLQYLLCTAMILSETVLLLPRTKRDPGLNAVFQLRPYKVWEAGNNHLCGPSGCPSSNAVQDTVDILGYKCTLLAYIRLFILFRSIWMASLPSVVSAPPLSLVSLANLLKMHSIPSSMSLIKVLKSTRHTPGGI